jgi:hypothetical protein
MTNGEEPDDTISADRQMIGELRRLWCEGIENGPSEPLDMDEIKRQARTRLGVRETTDD